MSSKPSMQSMDGGGGGAGISKSKMMNIMIRLVQSLEVICDICVIRFILYVAKRFVDTRWMKITPMCPC